MGSQWDAGIFFQSLNILHFLPHFSYLTVPSLKAPSLPLYLLHSSFSCVASSSSVTYLSSSSFRFPSLSPRFFKFAIPHSFYSDPATNCRLYPLLAILSRSYFCFLFQVLFSGDSLWTIFLFGFYIFPSYYSSFSTVFCLVKRDTYRNKAQYNKRKVSLSLNISNCPFSDKKCVEAQNFYKICIAHTSPPTPIHTIQT
jgi:hypothetical protein